MKSKDKSALFTPDLFGAKRRGRPPKIDAMTNAERQKKWRDSHKAVLVGERMADTITSLSKQFDLTRAEVTAHLLRYALCNKNWSQTGFPSL